MTPSRCCANPAAPTDNQSALDEGARLGLLLTLVRLDMVRAIAASESDLDCPLQWFVVSKRGASELSAAPVEADPAPCGRLVMDRCSGVELPPDGTRGRLLRPVPASVWVTN